MEEIALKLKHQRTKFGLTLEQVEKETRVRSNIIAALEKNNMELLPATYIQAFIKTLTEFYQKIEANSEYLNQVKTRTVSTNNANPKTPKQIINNYNKQLSQTTENKINNNKLTQKNKSKTDKPPVVVAETNNTKNDEHIKNDFAKTPQIIDSQAATPQIATVQIADSQTETSQIQNVFTNEKIKLEVVDDTAIQNSNFDKNPTSDYPYYDSYADGFSIKKKDFENANLDATTTNSNATASNAKLTVKEFNESIALGKNAAKGNDRKGRSRNNARKQNAENSTNEKTTVDKKTKIKQKKLSSNKRYFANTLNLSGRDLFVYLFLVVFLLGVIFFVFFYDESMFDNLTEKMNVTSYAEDIDDSTLITETRRNQLFSYFEPLDSIILVARCKDTAWVKVEIDRKRTDDVLMHPGMERRWTAWERIVLNTSNIGGIAFYKNDTLLPDLGAAGAMVNNIVITREGIANATPLTTSNRPVSANELNPTQVKINSSETDTARTSVAKPAQPKRKRDTVKPPLIIDFSTPPTTRPTILEENNQTETTR